MTASYFFAGHANVAAHVAHCLEPLGWQRVADASLADIVFTYCTDAAALEDAYFDAGGIVKNARPGTLLVDLSPASPSLAREVAAVATVNDLRPVEAPLAIVDPTLPEGFGVVDNVMCYVAGEPDDVDEAIDVVETIAGAAVRTGNAGSAQLAKASHTMQLVAQVVAAIESDALARATNAANVMLEGSLESVPAASALSLRVLDAVAREAYQGAYTVEMLMGEVAAAMSAADDVDLILPQLESVMHLLEVLAVIGGADKAVAALSVMYRDEADAARHGLDWSRAEDLFAEYEGQTHHHDHDHDHFGYDDDDDFGFFGGYSAN